MAILTLAAILVAVVATLYGLFSYLSARSEEESRREFALRRVPYLPQPNAFIQSIKKERLEVKRDELIKANGKLFGFNFLNRRTVLCAEPDIAQLVMSKEFTSFPNRRPFESADPFFSNNVSVTVDEKWKRLRSVITPTFSAGKLKRMKPCLDDTLRTLISNFDDALKKGSSLDIKNLSGSFTMDTIVQVAFGVKIDSLVEADHPVIVNAKRLFSNDLTYANLVRFTLLFMAPKLANLLGIRINAQSVDYFNVFSTKIIADKRKSYLKGGGHGKASNFIELMLEAEAEEGGGNFTDALHGEEKENLKYMTNEEIIAHCILFFIAGYDTTASTITLAAHNLAVNPATQEKLHQEIHQIISKMAAEARAADPTASIDPIDLVTVESLNRFEYLNACLNESLRIYSPATFTERLVGRDMDLKTEDGRVSFSVKKGDIIHFPIYSMHRDAEQFPEPEAFRPERFLDDPKHHKYAFMPFGQGPRSCVARSLALAEAKLALLHLVRLYRLGVAPETTNPPEFFYQSQALIPKNLILKVEKRTQVC